MQQIFENQSRHLSPVT